MAYLESIPGRHVTAAQVYEELKKQDCAIGNTTVYRYLERLVDEGMVNKYMIDANSPACFEFVGKQMHQGKGSCFHCKCEKCGKLIHLHCEELEMIASHLQKEHQFTLDPLRTVFYGSCEECTMASAKETGGDLE